MRFHAGFAIAFVATTAAADPDPAQALDDLAAARKVIASQASCVPRGLRPKLSEDGSNVEPHAVDLQLGNVAGKPVLCAVERIDYEDKAKAKPVGTLACWDVDVAHKQLHAAAPQLLPGLPVSARLTKNCTHGLCLPTGTPASDDAMISLDDTGTTIAVFVDSADRLKRTAYVFDRATRALVKTQPMTSSPSLEHVVYVADHLLTLECAAGPACELQVLDAAHPDLEPRDPTLHDHAGKNLFLGTLWVLAPGIVALADAGWLGFERYNVATGTLTAVRHRKPPKCIADYDLFGERCQNTMKRDVLPYSEAPVVALGKGYLAALSAPRAGDLATLDGKLAEKASFNAYCTR